MSYHDEFKSGFLAGWKSVKGQGAGIPGIPPTPTLPAGKTYFDLGYAKGVERANSQ